MDPDACLRRFVEACHAGDRDEALAALDDLRVWIARGGVFPTAPLPMAIPVVGTIGRAP